MTGHLGGIALEIAEGLGESCKVTDRAESRITEMVINCDSLIIIPITNRERITPRFSGRAITAKSGKLSMRGTLIPVRCKRLFGGASRAGLNVRQHFRARRVCQ
jgi:hypothetical protein